MFRFGNQVKYSSALFSYYFVKEKPKKEFTYEEIEKHTTKENKIYTTYKNNVYDITQFVDIHPGGKDYIMKCAGNSIEPFWDKYNIHYKSEILNTILSPMKIGSIKNYDENKFKTENQYYINEPIRHNFINLIYHSLCPCNAEINYTKDLINNYITPVENWYIRNHYPVPIIDKENYKLTIDLSENKSSIFNFFSKNIISYSLKDLQKYEIQDVVATLQCGGNRRSELNKVQKTMGTPWKSGALCNGKFSGVFLKDLLPKNISDNIKYVNVYGIDGVEVSIPIEKVTDINGDVLLAYKMNDKELTLDHGYPLRLIVPGYVGIKNIKWIKSISLSEKALSSTWQSGISYKAFPNYIKTKEDLDKNNFNSVNYYSINSLPIQSIICDVVENDENITIKGIAYSGNGNGILNVDVSIDNGETWNSAKLKEGSEQNPKKSWAWTFWEYSFNKDILEDDVDLYENFYDDFIPNYNNSKQNLEIICKATDVCYNTQQKTLEDAWNIRGLNNNSYHKFIYEL